MTQKKSKKNSKFVGDYVRSSMFGIQDSLVSTTGMIAGIAVATSDKKLVILAGAVAIAVEATSMSAGEYTSVQTEKQLGGRSMNKVNPLFSGFLMFVSYFLAGFVPLLPIIFLPIAYSVPAAIVAAMAGLFALGIFKGTITRRNAFRNGLQVLIIGGVATAIGVAVGVLLKV